MVNTKSNVVGITPSVFTDTDPVALKRHLLWGLGTPICFSLGFIWLLFQGEPTFILVPWLVLILGWAILSFGDSSHIIASWRNFRAESKGSNPGRSHAQFSRMILGGLTPRNSPQLHLSHEFVISQNMATGKCLVNGGFKLAATSIHIKPNYTDLLRRIYDMKHHLPITVRIALDGSRSHREFSYSILITKLWSRPSRLKLSTFLRECDQILSQCQSMLDSEFPHYRFSRLTVPDLIQSMRGSCGVQPVIPTERTKRYWQAAILMPLLRIVLIGVLTGITFSKIETINSLLIMGGAGLGYLSIQSIFQILRGGFLLRFKNRPFTLYDLYPQENVFRDRASDKIIIADSSTGQISIPYYFTFLTFNRAFRFQSIKFYRNLIYYMTALSKDRPYRISFEVEWRARRILPPNLERFSAAFENSFWTSWMSSTIRPTVERNVAGFYSLQPVFRITFHHNHLDENLTLREQHDLAGILGILRGAFPNSVIKSLPDSFGYDFAGKNYHHARYSGQHPLHVFTGFQLAPFIQIPDEIHKSLPMQYAGEFATPFLDDELVFGETLNPENMQNETPGGLLLSEIWKNVLICGEDIEKIDRASQSMATALDTRNQPMIIFDWDGSWDRNLLPTAEYRTAGEQIGLHLFHLFADLPGDLIEPYFHQVGDLLANVLRWKEDQVNQFTQLWRKCYSGDQPIGASDVASQIEVKDSSRYRQSMFDFLASLDNQNMPSIFQRDLISYLRLETLVDDHTTLVINLDSIKIPSYKVLFVHLFLIKLQLIYEYLAFVEGDKIIPNTQKILVLPQFNHFADRRVNSARPQGLLTVFENLFRSGYGIIGSTSNVTQVEEGLFPRFQSYFVFRTMTPNALRILTHVLNIDNSYTNTFSQNSRNASYQTNMISTLMRSDCVVYRAKYRFPYVFSFARPGHRMMPVGSNRLLTEGSLMGDSPSSSSTQGIGDDSLEKSFLDVDYGDRPGLIPILMGLFRHLDAILEHYTVLSQDQILTELIERMPDFFAAHQIDSTQQPYYCKDLIVKLERQGYLESTTFTGGKGIDITGFILGDKAKQILATPSNPHLSDPLSGPDFPKSDPDPNLSETSNLDDFFTPAEDLPEDVPFPVPNQGGSYEDAKTIPIRLPIRPQSRTSQPSLGDTVIPPVDPTPNDISSRDPLNSETTFDRRPFSLDDGLAWKDDIRPEIMDLLVQGRMHLIQNTPNEIPPLFEKTLTEIIDQIANYPRSEMLFQDCRDFQLDLEEVDFTDYGGVTGYLDRFEMFVVSF